MEKKKVLVIGSGPIIIGQAAEFDYAGTQACQSLREEGYEVVLVNSNPATIMTDRDIADRVYIEPISLEFVTEIIRKERPYGIGHFRRSSRLKYGSRTFRSGCTERIQCQIIGHYLRGHQTSGRP